jgi:hypothetical protein
LSPKIYRNWLNFRHACFTSFFLKLICITVEQKNCNTQKKQASLLHSAPGIKTPRLTRHMLFRRRKLFHGSLVCMYIRCLIFNFWHVSAAHNRPQTTRGRHSQVKSVVSDGEKGVFHYGTRQRLICIIGVT